MKFRRLRRLTLVLLPLMVLRTLLPAGFMPMADASGLHLVLCEAGIHAPAAHGADHAHAHTQGHDHAPDHMHGHDHAQDPDQGGQQRHADTGDCLFAHASVNAPPAHLLLQINEPQREVRYLPAAGDELPAVSGPPRAASARAPPVHS